MHGHAPTEWRRASARPAAAGHAQQQHEAARPPEQHRADDGRIGGVGELEVLPPRPPPLVDRGAQGDAQQARVGHAFVSSRTSCATVDSVRIGHGAPTRRRFTASRPCVERRVQVGAVGRRVAAAVGGGAEGLERRPSAASAARVRPPRPVLAADARDVRGVVDADSMRAPAAQPAVAAPRSGPRARRRGGRTRSAAPRAAQRRRAGEAERRQRTPRQLGRPPARGVLGERRAAPPRTHPDRASVADLLHRVRRLRAEPLRRAHQRQRGQHERRRRGRSTRPRAPPWRESARPRCRRRSSPRYRGCRRRPRGTSDSTRIGSAGRT